MALFQIKINRKKLQNLHLSTKEIAILLLWDLVQMPRRNETMCMTDCFMCSHLKHMELSQI